MTNQKTKKSWLWCRQYGILSHHNLGKTYVHLQKREGVSLTAHTHTEHCVVGGSGLSSSPSLACEGSRKMTFPQQSVFASSSFFLLVVLDQMLQPLYLWRTDDGIRLKALKIVIKWKKKNTAAWEDKQPSFYIRQQANPVAVPGWQINDGLVSLKMKMNTL